MHAASEARYRAAERALWARAGAEPRERRVRLEHNRVTVRVQEVGDGEPLLFVHGANTSGASWVRLAAGLPQYRCLLLDRPGTGLSEALPRRLDVSTLARFGETLIPDVLDALDINSAHVVATSFGGYIALRTAAAHPDRVGRMVQFSWPVGAPVTWLPWFMRMTSVPGIAALMAAMPINERTVHAMFRRIGHSASLVDGRITREDLDTYEALLRETDTLRNELALGRAFVSPVRGLNKVLLPESVLAAVRTPTLFLWGENDPFGGEDTARRVVAMIPSATLQIVAGAGHAPWLDDLQHCVSEVARFCAPGRSA